jgi:predicted PurR-regulated permease PerM
MTWQTTFMIAAAIFLGLGLLGSMWKLARPLAILVLGLSLASALASPAGWLSHWIPRMFSVILVHALLIIVLVGVGILIAPPLASQAQDVSAGLPQALDWLNVQAEHIGLQGLQSIAENATSSLTGLGSQLLKLPMTLWNTFLDIIVVFALSFYALLAAPAANRFFLSLLPRNRRDDMEHVVHRIVKGMGGYLRGIFIMGVIVGVVTYIGLLILGVPYPIVLSVLAGLLEFVPVLGTTVSVIVITAVAASQSITLGLITFVFVEIVQLVEGNILFPTIVGRETHSSPLLNMFAFFAGISVGGILGGIVAVPLAVALRAVFVEAVAPALRRKMGTNPT